MRFTCTLSDDLFSELEQRYGGPDRTKAAMVSAAIDDLIHRSDDLCTDHEHQLMITDHQVMISTLETVTAERDQALEALTKITADWDRMQEQISTKTGEVDRLKIEAAGMAQALDEKKDEIRWLRGECSKLNDRLMPAALTEQAGQSRRWWQIWRD